MKLEMTKYLHRSSYSTKIYCVNFYTFVLNVCCHIDNVTKHCAVFYVIFDGCLINEFFVSVRHIANTAMLSCFKIMPSNLLWWSLTIN